jgi:hypothetical protein
MRMDQNVYIRYHIRSRDMRYNIRSRDGPLQWPAEAALDIPANLETSTILVVSRAYLHVGSLDKAVKDDQSTLQSPRTALD